MNTDNNEFKISAEALKKKLDKKAMGGDLAAAEADFEIMLQTIVQKYGLTPEQVSQLRAGEAVSIPGSVSIPIEVTEKDVIEEDVPARPSKLNLKPPQY